MNDVTKSMDDIKAKIDAQRLRADTAEAELKVVRKSREDELENYNAMIADLAAAEQRIAELLDPLRDINDAPGGSQFRKSIAAALNPNPEAESHGN